MKNRLLIIALLLLSGFFVGTAFADTIDPVSYTDTLAVGESVTVRKTVTIDDAAPTSGVLDVMFLIDTSGSMGGEIDAAKAAAADILTGLSSFGDLATGVGYYSEPGSLGVYHDLTTDTSTAISDINSIYLGLGGNGGDFPEEGINAVYEAASDASWRVGSTRFIIALGDATFKESDGVTLAMASAALADSGATFIGIDYGYPTSYNLTSTSYGGISPEIFANDSGGSIITSSGLNVDDLVDDIISGVEASFSEYGSVTVSDLGAGMPGVGVSVEAVSGEGTIVGGDTFVGDFDRSAERIFTFDVTFTGLAEGGTVFETLALLDGGAVAREIDSFTVTGDTKPVPEPGTIVLLGVGLLGLVAARRKLK